MAFKGVGVSLTLKLSDLGIWVAVIVFVLAQFVEVELFSVGSIPITLQKLLAVVLYPFSVILMGRIRVSGPMILFALTLIVSYTLAFWANGHFSPEAESAVVVVLVGFAGATVLYTALTLRGERGFRMLAYTWIAFSVGTAAVTVLQAVGLFPFLTVPDEYIQYREAVGGLYRGVGLKFDPNFQALMLVIGVMFAQFYLSKGWLRLLVFSVIFLGIVGTFSRMGLLLVMLLIAINPVIQRLGKRRGFIRTLVELAGYLLVVSSVGFAVYVWGPPSIGEYLGQRLAEVGSGLALLVSGETATPIGHLSSAETRALLAKAALILALQNWATGVGAYQTDSVIFEYIGIPNVAHNTYLELFLIGGVWGVISILTYATIVFRSLWLRGNGQLVVTHRNALLALALVLAFAGMFLSLTYNSVVWLPIVLAPAMRKWMGGRCR